MLIQDDQLKGLNVAITGASSGIGKETAIMLGELGANLILGSRNEAALTSVLSHLQTDSIAAVLDVTDEESVCSFAHQAISRYKQIDALINCAGVGVFDSLLDLNTDEFDRMIAVNLRGAFLCCKYFGRHMVEKQAGRIINLVSIAGVTALPGCGGYSASKFGVLGLSRVLQAELRTKGVFVTSVLPGAVSTSFWDTIDNKPDRSAMIPAKVLAKHLVYLLCQTNESVIDEMMIMPPHGIL